MKVSEITVIDAWQKCHMFLPIKLYWNDKLVWDDDVNAEDWVRPEVAIERYKETLPGFAYRRVYDIKIEVVDFHHSIVRMYSRDGA